MRLAVVLAVLLATSGCIQIELDQTPDASESRPSSASAAAPKVPKLSLALDPSTPRVGQAISFELQVSGFGQGDSFAGASWRFGDGGTSNQKQPIHVFRATGSYLVDVVVTTAKGARATLERSVVVLSPSAAPTGSSVALPAVLLDSPSIVVQVEANRARFAFEAPYEVDQVHWSFGDGANSTAPTPEHEYLSVGDFVVELRVGGKAGVGVNSTLVTILEVPFSPHVVVGVPDSGFNVYHDVYSRPEATVHPCKYVRGYPCDIPALHLSLDADSWEEAFAADKAIWQSVRPGDRYWIPGTNIIGAVCDTPYVGSTAGSTDPLADPDLCIIGDTSSHGTGTSSSVLSENPDALLIVVEGNSGGADYLTDGFYPVDVVNYSWGAAVPLFAPVLLAQDFQPMFVAASGNEGAFPVVLDTQKAHTSVITVGAADGATRTEPGYSGFKTMDFVSEYCRPAAHSEELHGEDEYCGTSFASPTFAGALSRLVLEVRRASGYDGTVRNGMIDPVLGISKSAVREALNHTASYDPQSPFPAGSEGVPLLAAAPFYQWGWGYVARNEVPAALACLLQGDCPTKDAATVAYMEALWELRKASAG